MGIVLPFAPRGVIRGKFVLIVPKGVNGHRRPVSGAPSSGTARKSHAKFEMGPCRDCRRVLVYLARRPVFGEIRFIETPGVQDYGGRRVAKRSSDPRVAYSEVKVQVRDL